MKLEITKNQADELRTQGGKVLEETRYYAIVAQVAAEVHATTKVLPDEPVSQPVTKKRKAYKRRVSKLPRVFQHDTIKLDFHQKPKFYTNNSVASNVYWSVMAIYDRSLTKTLTRNQLEREIAKLLPEHTSMQITKGVSALVSKKVLVKAGD